MKMLTRGFATMLGLTLTVPLPAQQPRAEEVPYYRQVSRLGGISNVTNPRLSRDARFIAFEAANAGQGGYHIFVMPVAGGTPVQVTTGDHDDQQPAWFPTGDRIAFYSDRLNAVMTVAIDPSTGKATGPLKRVSVENSQVWIDVSPDGKSIAYVVQTGKSPNFRTTIRVVPSSGGAARTVSAFDGSVQFLRYDREGRFLYFTHFRPPLPNEPTISRVPSTGGALQPGGKFGNGGFGGLIADPVANRVLKRDCGAANNCRVAHIYTLTGDSLGTVAWAQHVGNARTFAFAPDGSALFTTTDNSTTAVHAVPLDGRPVRVLTDGSKNESPYEWRRDNRILYRSETSVPGLSYVSSEGKERGFIEINPNGITPTPDAATEFYDSSPDGRYFIITVDTGRINRSAVRKSYYIFDSQTRAVREVSRNFVRFPFSVPGGRYNGTGVMGNEWILFVMNGSTLEMRALSTTGTSRLVRALPRLDPEGLQMAVGNDRFAYPVTAGDSTSIVLTVGKAAARHVLTVKGSRIFEMSFSPDSRVLFAAVASDSGSASRRRGVFLTIGDDGSVTQPPRWQEVGGEWYDPHWLPDGEAVLIQRVNGTYTAGSLWRVPVGPGEPRQILHRERAYFETFKLSPDGREIAVAAAHQQSSTMWRIDLSLAMPGAKRGRE